MDMFVVAAPLPPRDVDTTLTLQQIKRYLLIFPGWPFGHRDGCASFTYGSVLGGELQIHDVVPDFGR